MIVADCFQAYQAAIGGLTTAAACDHLAQSAFVDYCRGRLSDAEYSTIYYACDSRSLEIRTSYKRIRPSVIR